MTSESIKAWIYYGRGIKTVAAIVAVPTVALFLLRAINDGLNGDFAVTFWGLFLIPFFVFLFTFLICALTLLTVFTWEMLEHMPQRKRIAITPLPALLVTAFVIFMTVGA